jgi:ABC-type sugar transport system permease subunit
MSGSGAEAGLAARAGIRDRQELLAKRMITPAILYVVVLIGIPFVMAIFYSLSAATTGDLNFRFVGLRNFQATLADPVFRLSLKNTFFFALVSQTLVILLSRILATALMQDFRGKWLARFLIMLPWTAPIALGTIGWLWMLDSIFSPIGVPTELVRGDVFQWGPLMAGGLLASIPVAVVYTFFLDRFIAGFTMGAVK